MFEELLGQAGAQLLSTGLVGAFAVYLLKVLADRSKELSEERQAHKLEIAEKDKRIAELEESRLEEVKAIVETISSNRLVLESVKPLLDRVLEALNVLRGQGKIT